MDVQCIHVGWMLFRKRHTHTHTRDKVHMVGMPLALKLPKCFKRPKSTAMKWSGV